MIEFLAQAPAQPQQQPGAFEMLFPIVVVGVLFWLILFRPRSQEQKKLRELMDSLKKGDRVMTIGGIIATVVQLRDDEVVLKVDEATNTKVTFARSAIKSVLSAGATPESKSAEVRSPA